MLGLSQDYNWWCSPKVASEGSYYGTSLPEVLGWVAVQSKERFEGIAFGGIVKIKNRASVTDYRALS